MQDALYVGVDAHKKRSHVEVGRAFLSSVELPEVDRSLLDEDLELLDAIQQRVGATEALIAKLSEGDPIIEWLSSLPGIGAFLADQTRQQASTLGDDRSRDAGGSVLALLSTVLRTDQAKQRHWRRTSCDRAETPGIGLDCLDGRSSSRRT